MRYEGIGAAIEGWGDRTREGWGLIEGAGYCAEGRGYRPKDDG